MQTHHLASHAPAQIATSRNAEEGAELYLASHAHAQIATVAWRVYSFINLRYAQVLVSTTVAYEIVGLT